MPYTKENLSGGLLAGEADSMLDWLCSKFGQHWPMVVYRKRLLCREDALWLKRVLTAASSTRRTRTCTLNRLFYVISAVGYSPTTDVARYR